MATALGPYVQPFTTALATDPAYAGGKGAALARLSQAQFPIPPGGVLCPEALVAVLDAAHVPFTASAAELRQAALSAPLPATLAADGQALLTALGPAPHGWAVRSSALAEDRATASYAGIYESWLAIPEAELWPTIRACWAAWWSDRAIAYRQQVGEDEGHPRMAVVLQHLVPARCAGVAFTAEPISDDRTRLVIHAASGLGVAVVSGIVQPEQYTLAKTPALHLIETRFLTPDSPPLLAPAMTLQLADLCLRIEELAGSPQDIEWVWDGAAFWIVQSRPITTLGDDLGSSTSDVWGNANLKDVLPGLVSPFTWSLMQPQLEKVMRQQYDEAGYVVDRARPLIRRFWGRPYFNISLFNEAAYALYGATPELQAAQIGGLVPPESLTPAPPSFGQRLRWLRNSLRFLRIARRARQVASAEFAAVQRRWREERRSVPYLDRSALLQKMESYEDIADPFLLLHLNITLAMSGSFSLLRDLVTHAMPEASGVSIAAELVSGLGEVSSAEQSYALWQLSRQARQSAQVLAFLEQGVWQDWERTLAGTDFLAAWQRFLETYGHRALYEVEIANPRWREQPDYLFTVLASYARLEQEQPPFDPQLQAQRRQTAECQVLQHLRFGSRTLFRYLLQRAQTFSRLRENSKSHLVQLLDIGRMMMLRAAHFLVQDGFLDAPESIFLFEAEEVKHALRRTMTREALQPLLPQRRLERQRYATRHMPDLFIGNRPVYTAAPAASETVLTGLPSSPGRVQGLARVLYAPHEGARVRPGDILVVPSTDPGWTPLFLLAAGLVMETGGYLSHGAIVAREYGIPAVLNVPQATQHITDGQTILIDGAQGTVHLF
jgi:pyruvate,water dikinase